MHAVLCALEKDVSILVSWFRNNYLKLNPDKCHFLLSKHKSGVHISVETEIIECENSVKLLGVTIDNELKFNEHISNICKKANQKLHALARVSKYMSQEKLRVLMKAFIESQFGYCPLIWIFCNRSMNHKINRLHERALRLIYKDDNLTFEELLCKDKSFSIHHRNLQKLAIEMYKIVHNLSPILMHTIFPQRIHPYDLRNNNPFQSANVRSVFNGTETLSFRGPKTWLMLPDEIKNSISLNEFRAKIKLWEPKGCTCRICKTYVQNVGFIE